jgi:hypothetical protein
MAKDETNNRSEKYEKTSFKVNLDDTEKLDWTIPNLLDDPKNELVQVIFKVDNPDLQHETYLSKIISRANVDNIFEAMELQNVDEDVIYEYCMDNTVGLSRYEGYNIKDIEIVIYSHI